ncbi:MAG: phosphate uptake regulator PhoU, partial [Candidatus Thermoplasmatota archaeon]|nr:phosphate uptake regulator PhoU [Candidatus Thermoplasmatota archaeon]
SYVVTLPKEWIKSSHIKKNDPLGIHMQSNGTLLITSKMTREQQKIKNINMKYIEKQTFLFRRLIAAYIAGFTTIKIISDDRLSPEIRTTIRKFTQSTIGQEVVEETDHSITLKDLLNPTEMPFDRTIKRMHIILKGMHEDVLRSLETSDNDLAQDVIQRDSEIDRLHWLIARQHNSILQNMSLAEKMNITIGLSSTYYTISRIIERIGDHIVKIAKNIQKINILNLEQSIKQQIKTSSELALLIFANSIHAFFRKSIQESNKNIESVIELENRCEEIDKLTLKQKGITAVSVGYIVESIRRIGEYAEDISENVINYLTTQE